MHAKKSVLIIEDHMPMRVDLTKTLEHEGYCVYPAANGKEGIKLAAKHRPSLILCDVMLPQLNGYQVFSAVRRNAETAAIPFVFMSGSNVYDEKYTRTADHYIVKPFSHHTLIDIVGRRIKESESEKQQGKEELEHIEALEHILQTISHELRNPICSSLGLASLLDIASNKKKNVEETRRIIEGIKANALRLDEITGILTDVVYQALQNYRKKME